MNQQELYEQIKTHRKIASIKYNKHLERALENDVSGVFLLTGNIGVIKRYVDLFLSKGRFVFLHLEKIGGLQVDREGLDFIASYVKPTGVISTKSSIIKQANKLGLRTIQRVFLVDSDALQHGVEMCNTVKPDAIELMPGIIPTMIEKVKTLTDIPIITGGLISTAEEMKEPLKHGAIAVSTGNPALWGVHINGDS
ncbi:glycerol-3-phosphate responsive antiterminator [Aneurinibacillus sp. Ricciae_BoGa-3]|uniref:glycerol-3-phosphate responsive antiterminator n=1 Tax=Aneurinibacillus sp. Ricciae_BoGa-3 TaxID=3022697 RepID=UPI00233FB61B|nr:glycerol-3-phosphate responsive antiterminator [Aneurinibacillus sp. Ricciae_BoGa-3]WCK54899.1 glycerol-3-phosphate responsive antiterminator [Aneurinibacillus sp. Ricciae_BoGa-3]